MFIFFLFIDTDRGKALAEGRETTRRYVELISSFVPPATLVQLRSGDPLKIFLDLLQSLPDRLEEQAIIGTPQECRRRLAELQQEFGVEHVAFYFHAGARDVRRARQGLELFAREVMPEFRSRSS